MFGIFSFTDTKMHSTIYDFTEESDKFLCHELFISISYDNTHSNILLQVSFDYFDNAKMEIFKFKLRIYFR